MTGRVAQVVEHPLSKHEILISTAGTAKKVLLSDFFIAFPATCPGNFSTLKNKDCQAPVARACNPRYSEAEIRRISV
jgi:hypothetical protein